VELEPIFVNLFWGGRTGAGKNRPAPQLWLKLAHWCDYKKD